MTIVNPSPNWHILSEAGVSSASSIGGEVIRVQQMSQALALKLGYAATIEIDELSGRPIYPNLSSEEYNRLFLRDNSLETRPDDRNCAVKVQKNGTSYDMTIDIRNEYEDDATLRPKGVALIQSCFIIAVESLEL